MITEGNFAIMGAVAAAIAVPPIGLGIATFMNKKKFEQPEIEAGKASFTMDCSASRKALFFCR